MSRIETERLTPQRALEISRDLWTWLAGKNGREKKDWPGWNSVGQMHNLCSLCELMWPIGESCVRCPVEWLGRPNRAGETAPCEREGSPYLDWLGSCSAGDAKRVLALIEASLVAIKEEREGTWT